MKVPYLPQMEARECGAAALAMVLGAHGHHAPLAEVRDVCGVSRDGLTARQVADAAARYGMAVNGYRVTPKGLAQFRHPVILHWEMNHFVVLEAWGRTSSRIVDPAVGRRVVSAAELDRAFTGIVLDMTPGPSFERRRRRNPWIRVLLGTLAERPGALAMLVTCAVAIDVLALTLPIAMQLIVDAVLPASRAAWLTVIGVALLALVLVHGLFVVVRERLGLAFNVRFEALLSERFVRHLLRLPLAFFEQRSTGDLVDRVQAIGAVRSLLAGGAVVFLSDGLLLVSLFALMAVYDMRLALVVAAAAAAYTAMLTAGRGRQVRLLQRQDIEETRSSSELVQILWGLPTLKAGGTEDVRRARWTTLLVNELNAGFRSRTFEDRIGTALFAIRVLTPAVVLLWGARLVLDGEMTLGVLVGFQLLQAAFLQSLAAVADALVRAQSLPVLIDRLGDVLGAAPAPDGTQPCPPLDGTIAVEHLTFAYSVHGRPAVDDVSFEIARGQRVAIVGASGSGKSTLFRLLLGLYEPSAGRVLVNGVPLAALDRGSFRRQIGVVLQDTMLFAGTIRENLSLSDPDAPLEDIVQAARAAQIHDHIESLPLGYDTIVSSSQGALSGGQRQRLALARAILRRPPIVFLDEATSALDPITEAAIDAYFERQTCTRIVIAHRLDTVRDADVILVLDEGRIVERGSHDELQALGGTYARLVRGEIGPSLASAPAESIGADSSAAPASTQSAPAAAGGGSAAAALAALMALQGRSVPLARVRDQCGSDAGMTTSGMIAAARTLGCSCRPMTLDARDLRASAEPLILELRDRQFVVARRGRRGRVEVTDGSGAEIHGWEEAYTRQCFEIRPDVIGRRGMPARVRAFVAVRRHSLAHTVVAIIVVQAAALATPLLAGFLIDEVVAPGDAGGLTLALIGFAAAILLAVAHSGIRLSVMRYLRAHFDRELLGQMMAHLLSLPLRFFDTHNPGTLIQRFQTFRIVRNLLGADPASVVLDLAVMNVAAGALLLFQPSLALLVGGIAALSFLIGAACLGPLRRLVEDELEADAVQQDRLIELLRGVATLRAGGQEDGGAARWIPLLWRRLEARFRQERLGVVEYTILGGLRLLALAVLVWWGAARVLDGSLSLGAFVSFYGIAAIMLGAIASTASKLVPAAHVVLHVRRLHEVFDAAPEQDRTAIRPPGRLSGRIRFENVTFSYAGSDAKAIDGLSLDIEPGMMVAIVGASGAGKTTVARLLAGLYRPDAGRVLLDGKDLWGLDLTAVRQQLGVVLQDPYLFTGSIRQNVSLGVPDLPVEDVWRAIGVAGMTREVAALPMQLGTFVGEAGATFSGGQRQRLAIARAVIRRPPIVVFDEATSALDNLSQRAVQNELAGLACTRIVIAHRLSTILGADRIFVLDRGAVVECGTHAELVAKRGSYARLMRPQMAEVT